MALRLRAPGELAVLSRAKEELYLTSSFTTRRQPMEEFIKNLRAKEIHLAIDAVDMIEYLKANPYVLDAVQGHYDYLARKRLSIFDPDRAVKDIEAMALDAFQGGNNRSFCNTEPSAPIVQVTRDPSHKLGRGNGGASEFGDDDASQDGGAPDLISSDDESEELGAAGTSGG